MVYKDSYLSPFASNYKIVGFLKRNDCNKLMEKIGFRPEGERQVPYGEHIGEWILVSHGSNEFSAGFVKEIDNSGIMKLNPYEGIIYSQEWGPMRKIICNQKDYSQPVPINQIGKIEKTDLANLEKRVRFMNDMQIKSVISQNNQLASQINK